ncbi:MAG: alpha-glucosidase [Treponemataceae bacterium]|nr:alpha-glucosidase [Treponemataceae bacterium]
MIFKYTFGNPFHTESAVLQIPSQSTPLPEKFGSFTCFSETNPVPKTQPLSQSSHKAQYLCGDEPAAFLWRYKMQEADRIFGLGENVRGMNRRGNIFESYCSDNPHHTEDCKSLYGAHNFLIIAPEAASPFGIFFDYPGRIVFDLGFSQADTISVIAPKAAISVYIITAEDDASESAFTDICSQFRKLTGTSYIPPRWAFGYMQSRWGYRTAEEIRAVADEYRKSDIPLEALFLDIDYMDSFQDFTVDSKAFPEFNRFVAQMAEDELHLVPIIDAGVKINKGYPVYEEGLKKGFFCADKSGDPQRPFTAAVWPGVCHFPDFLNKDARNWFGKNYRTLLECGIEGFWNDMNEPALFYTEEGLQKAFKEIDGFKNVNMGIGEYFRFTDTTNLSNRISDYKSFFHKVSKDTAGDFAAESPAVSKGNPEDKDTTYVCHNDVHNLYGFNMTRSASEAIDELMPEKRILLFSRASCIGAHRYGGIWTGDNQSLWQHLKMNVSMMPSLNMCGFLYSGADIGGFGSDVSRELLLRWLQFAVFTPLMRNHSAMGTRAQEAFRFEKPAEFAAVIEARYRLLPYLYSEFMKAALNDGMYFKPLCFAYPKDSRAAATEDQLLAGESIMCAPVVEQNATGRYVYLPEPMRMVTFGGRDKSRASTEEAFAFEDLPAGDHWINVPKDKAVFFIRPGHAVPVAELPESGLINTASVSEQKLTLLSCPAAGSASKSVTYELYSDDGESKDYLNPKNYRTLTAEC